MTAGTYTLAHGTVTGAIASLPYLLFGIPVASWTGASAVALVFLVGFVHYVMTCPPFLEDDNGE